MRKVIATINMSIDGNCDHTAGLPSEELLQHYTDLLNSAGVILYGRTTYQLMQYWQALKSNPSDEKTANDFAEAIDTISKIVFSHQLKDTDWNTAELATKTIEDLVGGLRQQPGKDILVGSRSLIIQLMNLGLIDELQLCVHPVTAGRGLQLFEDINKRTVFKLIEAKNFSNGAITLYYEPLRP